jgi:hypothetical protein
MSIESKREQKVWDPEGKEEVVHACPPEGSGVMPCCGCTPFEVPTYHRITIDSTLVTCGEMTPNV